MIRALSSFLALMLAARSSAQTTQVSDFVSPCPNVFSYDPLATESDKWYGVINLTTDIPLYALWLNIVLENKANILGNRLGEVTTNDNIDFKIENTNMSITPEQPLAVHVFIQYNSNVTPPKLKAIRFNGREICQVEPQEVELKIPENTTRVAVQSPSRTESTSYGWSGNQQRVPDSGLQTQPYAKISIKQTESSQNFDQPRDTPLYVRPGDRQTISDSRYETKNNVDNIPQPYSGFVSENRQPARPINSYQQTTAQRQQNTDDVRPLKISGQNTAQRYEEGYQSWVEPARNGMVIQSGVDPSRYPTNDDRVKNLDGSSLSFDKYEITTAPPVPAPDYDNSNETSYDFLLDIRWDQFLDVSLRTLFSPKSTNPKSIDGKSQCGKVEANTTVLNGKSKLDTQWPWQTALYIDEGMGNNYACGGTLVTARHVITAAHCVTIKYTEHPVDQATLSVFLGKHNLWTSSDEVQIRFVWEIIVHPDYSASTYSRNVAILELNQPVKYTDWIKPACLWPENDIDQKNIIGKKGKLLSWRVDENYYLDDINHEEMPVVSQMMCIESHEKMVQDTSEYTYCAGNRRETSSCVSAGSGMVFKLGSTWHLRGLTSLTIPSVNGKRCSTTQYVIFTDLAKFLPWINSIVFDF